MEPESVTLIAALAAELPVAICGLSLVDEKVLFWNCECERLFGVPAEQVIGTDPFETVWSTARVEERGRQALRAAARSPAAGVVAGKFCSPSGESIPILCRHSGFPTGSGTPKVKVGIFIDLSPTGNPNPLHEEDDEYDRLTGELHAALHSLTRAECLASMGRLATLLVQHVNNPLSIIQTTVEVLRNARPDEEAAVRLLGEIEWEVGQITKIVQKMAEFTRERAMLVKEDLSVIVPEVTSLLRPPYGPRNVAIVTEIDEGPLLVEAGRGQVIPIVVGVISLAADSTDPGGEVRVVCRGEPFRVTMEVRGGSPGIGIGHLEDLHDPVRFVDRHPAFGPGLYAIRESIHGLGGSVEITHSADGVPAFLLTLPRIAPFEKPRSSGVADA